MVLLVRTGAALPLRRAADTVEADVSGPDDATGWDRLVLTRGNTDMAEQVLGYGPASTSKHRSGCATRSWPGSEG